MIINDLNRPRSQCIKTETSQRKAICTNIGKVKIFCVLHNKLALLTRTCSEWGTRNGHQIIFREVLTIRKRVDQKKR